MVGTSEGARKRYQAGGAEAFRRMIRDLEDRGWSRKEISMELGMNPSTISGILRMLELFGDQSFLIKPSTFERVDTFHEQILSRDTMETHRLIALRKSQQGIRMAHARKLKERKDERSWIVPQSLRSRQSR